MRAVYYYQMGGMHATPINQQCLISINCCQQEESCFAFFLCQKAFLSSMICKITWTRTNICSCFIISSMTFPLDENLMNTSEPQDQDPLYVLLQKLSPLWPVCMMPTFWWHLLCLFPVNLFSSCDECTCWSAGLYLCGMAALHVAPHL